MNAQPLAAYVDPPSTNADVGGSATFCVQAQGSGPFRYQWQKNGSVLTNQTNVCLVLTGVGLADGGSYRATVYNATGAMESEEGRLLLNLVSLPGGDNVNNSTFLTVVSNSVKGSSFGATREAEEPRHFNLTTSNSVWYTWQAPASGIITFDTRGSTFDTVMAVYGGGYGRLTEITGDDDGGGFHTSKVSWNAQAGINYQIVIDGVTGESGDYVCNWNLEVGAHLPTLTLRPRSQTVLPGATATFSAMATDPRGVVLFQWFHNGEPIYLATSSNLTVVNVQSDDLGEYYVAVTNSTRRSVVSPPVTLEIGPDPGVQSKDKIGEIPNGAGGGGGGGSGGAGGSLGTFSLAAGTIINQRFINSGTKDRCEPAHCGVLGGASRWFQLAAEANGVCTIDTLGSDVDTILAIYLQNFAICTNLYEPLVDCNNDTLGTCDQILTTAGGERSSQLSFSATPGAVYRAVVDTVGGRRGTNIQFNVRMGTAPTGAPAPIVLGLTTNCLLQLRGSSVALTVASNLVSSSSTFQWQVDGRAIAGATQNQLLLSSLNYSDAGRYSVVVRNGGERIVLPGAAVLVVDRCRGRMGLLGTTGEPIMLEATGILREDSEWEVIGPILPSSAPTLWDEGSGATRFYRARCVGP